MKRIIAFITDTHLNERLPVNVDQQANLEVILDDVLKRGATEIVHGGDIAQASHYADFFEFVTRYPKTLHLIPGNHDSVAHLLLHYPNPEFPDAPELYYSFSDDNFLYVFLDSSSDLISDAQLQWLAQKLEDNRRKVLLFVHHPVFAIDTYPDRKYPLKNRDALRKILEAQPFEIFIFCGHCHCEDETGSAAISQFATPAASYQVEKGVPDMQPSAGIFGYRLITLENANIRSEVITFKPNI